MRTSSCPGPSSITRHPIRRCRRWSSSTAARPASMRSFTAVLDAVATAPAPRFFGGGKWEAMHGLLGGWYEIRLTGLGREQFRLQFRLFELQKLMSIAVGVLSRGRGPAIQLVTLRHQRQRRHARVGFRSARQFRHPGDHVSGAGLDVRRGPGWVQAVRSGPGRWAGGSNGRRTGSFRRHRGGGRSIPTLA